MVLLLVFAFFINPIGASALLLFLLLCLLQRKGESYAGNGIRKVKCYDAQGSRSLSRLVFTYGVIVHLDSPQLAVWRFVQGQVHYGTIIVPWYLKSRTSIVRFPYMFPQ